MNIRLIALDLDGTLLTSDKRLSERNKRALEEGNIYRAVHRAYVRGNPEACPYARWDKIYDSDKRRVYPGCRDGRDPGTEGTLLGEGNAGD